jgi:hypothetical protein
VSRKHCELSERDGRLIVRDLGSLNGTFIGEARISDATTLPPGGKVTIGGVTLQAIYGDLSATQGIGGKSSNTPGVGAIGGTAVSVEQTVEMSDSGIPIPDELLAGRPKDDIDLGWLDEPNKQHAGSQELESIDDLASPQPATEELRFPDADSSSQTGGAEGSGEFAAPEPKRAPQDEDDLTDFFESLK